MKYIAPHPNSETREKWSGEEYGVNVREEGEAFMCMCKKQEMLCCHVVKVMIHLGVCEISRLHVCATLDSQVTAEPW